MEVNLKMNLPISEIKVNNPIRFNFGTIQVLAENIAEVGMLHSIVVNEKYKLVAGFRRLKPAELI